MKVVEREKKREILDSGFGALPFEARLLSLPTRSKLNYGVGQMFVWPKLVTPHPSPSSPLFGAAPIGDPP